MPCEHKKYQQQSAPFSFYVNYLTIFTHALLLEWFTCCICKFQRMQIGAVMSGNPRIHVTLLALACTQKGKCQKMSCATVTYGTVCTV